MKSVTEISVEKGTRKMNMNPREGMDYTILSLDFDKKQVFDGVFFTIPVVAAAEQIVMTFTKERKEMEIFLCSVRGESDSGSS